MVDVRILHEEIENCEDCPWFQEQGHGNYCANPDDIIEGECPDEGIHPSCPLPKKGESEK